MNDLAIELAGNSGPDDMDFHVLITEVSGSGSDFHPTTVLFESDTVTFNSAAPPTVVHIPLPNLALVPGKTYAFILDAFVTRDGSYGTAAIATKGTYTDGAFYFNQGSAGSSRTDHFADQWYFAESIYPMAFHDIAFQLSFEPSARAQEYLPLEQGTIWKYLKNGRLTVTREVLDKEVTVGGVNTRPVRFVEENVTEYLTSDENGIYLHREYQPHIYVEGVGWVDIDTTFIPPVKLAEDDVWIGRSFHSSGIAQTVVLPENQISYSDYTAYTADSTIEAEESITVPAGTFDTIRYHESISLYGITLSATRYLAKGIGIVKDISTNPQGKTSTFELKSMTWLTLLAPNCGETMPSGGTYDIIWESSPNMTTFQLNYSVDDGATWIPIPGAKHVTDTHYLWTVPIPAKDKKSCRIKVSGYNAANIKVKTDISDSPFTIGVVKVTSPDNRTEVWTSGELRSITWKTNETIRPVAKVQLFYTKNNGVTWLPIKTIKGSNPGTYDWTVPSLTTAKTNCKVKVVLRDSAGNSVGSDVSDQVFTMQPPP